MTVVRLMPASARRILQEVADKHTLSEEDVIGPCRTRDRSAALFELMHRLRSEVIINGDPASLYQIGQWCGGRHHSTVINGIARHAENLGLEPVRQERREPMLRQFEAMSTDDLKRAAALVAMVLQMRASQGAEVGPEISEGSR